MKKRYIAFMTLLIAIPLLLWSVKANANTQQHQTPSPTPSFTPTPTPYHFSCNEDHSCVKVSGKGENTCESNWQCQPHHCDGDDCITPSVTPTPTATPSATPPPSQGGTGVSDGRSSDPGATQPFHAVCTIPFTPPVIESVVTEGNGSVTVTWGEDATGITKFALTYGLQGQTPSMGQDNIPSSARTWPVHLLEIGQNYMFYVWAFQNGCAEISQGYDPKVL